MGVKPKQLAGGPASELYANSVEVSTTSTSETDLKSFSIPANTLAIDGERLVVELFGRFVPNASDTTDGRIRLRFGGTLFCDDNLDNASGNGRRYHARATIWRRGSSSQIAVCVPTENGSSTLNADITTMAIDLTAAVIVKVTGEIVGGGSGGEIFVDAMSVTKVAAP